MSPHPRACPRDRTHTSGRDGRHPAAVAAVMAGSLLLASCAGEDALPVLAGFGPDPVLPAPRTGLVPTIRIAPAIGWPAGEMPTPAAGFRVQAFASDLEHPRWLYRLPNGDILVAESNAPPREGPGGVRGFVQGLMIERAGSAAPSANRITLLRDADGDGVAELKTPFLTDLNSPFGMALIGDQLFIANADALVKVTYLTGQTRIEARPVKVTDLPSGRNHHWTKSLVASPDGRRLYVGVGSNSNVAEHGMDEEVERAAVLEIDPATGGRTIYASGLRNPVGMAWNPESGKLWVAVNERDEIGNDLVPDYMTSLTPGGFYGWPWSYFGQTVDTRVKPANPGQVAAAIRPDYALGSHTASLGLTFYDDDLMPSLRGGAIIGQRGSWNRIPASGYRVILVPFADGRPSGPPQDILTGFLNTHGRARGRPVGVETDARGALLVADDVGRAIWRVSPAQ